MKSLLAGLTTGLLSAALAAAASRPWGLGALALICYTPAFATILSTRSPLVGAVVAGIASLGVASVGYEATVGIFPGAYALTLLVLAGQMQLVTGRARQAVARRPVTRALLR